MCISFTTFGSGTIKFETYSRMYGRTMVKLNAPFASVKDLKNIIVWKQDSALYMFVSLFILILWSLLERSLIGIIPHTCIIYFIWMFNHDNFTHQWPSVGHKFLLLELLSLLEKSKKSIDIFGYRHSHIDKNLCWIHFRCPLIMLIQCLPAVFSNIYHKDTNISSKIVCYDKSIFTGNSMFYTSPTTCMSRKIFCNVICLETCTWCTWMKN